VWGVTFDACPHPRPVLENGQLFDGLTAEWPAWPGVTYMNCEFEKPGEFIKKATAEHKAGKCSIGVLPTSTMGGIARLIGRAGAIQFGEVDIPDWLAIEDRSISPLPREARQPCYWYVLPGLAPKEWLFERLIRLYLESVVGKLWPDGLPAETDKIGLLEQLCQVCAEVLGLPGSHPAPVTDGINLLDPISTVLAPKLGMTDEKKAKGRELVERAFHARNTVGDALNYIRTYHRIIGDWSPSDLDIGSYKTQFDTLKQTAIDATRQSVMQLAENAWMSTEIFQLEERIRQREAEIATLIKAARGGR
jgi:hypothetical protein